MSIEIEDITVSEVITIEANATVREIAKLMTSTMSRAPDNLVRKFAWDVFEENC